MSKGTVLYTVKCVRFDHGDLSTPELSDIAWSVRTRSNNDTDSETTKCESENENEPVSLHKAREGLMTAIDLFEQHPSLSPSHLEQLWSTLRGLDTTSTLSRKQACVTDFFPKITSECTNIILKNHVIIYLK